MPQDPNEFKAVDSRTLTALLEHFRRSGMLFLPVADQEKVRSLATIPVTTLTPSASTAAIAPASPTALDLEPSKPRSRLAPMVSHPVSVPARETYTGNGLPVLERTMILDQIASEVSSCTRCENLASTRTHTVPGEGNPAARLCFVGEAPGADEDASGRPFVGRAGQLLTKMIEACTFTREEVFILNTVKCRPPGNRNPMHDEVENCRGYLERQLETIRPEYIVCLGLVAAQTLLNSKLSIGRLRGQFHAYKNSKVIVTYHPSYLLREPEVKKAAWADLQFLLRDMGIQLPKK